MFCWCQSVFFIAVLGYFPLKSHGHPLWGLDGLSPLVRLSLHFTAAGRDFVRDAFCYSRNLGNLFHLQVDTPVYFVILLCFIFIFLFL